jgi:lysophospholipase L1-like esterase
MAEPHRRGWQRPALAAIVIALLALTGVGLATDFNLRTARRIARESLNLPKNWATGFFEDTSLHTEMPCPDPARTLLLVAGGQSNAANAYDEADPAAPPVPGAVMMWNGRCYGLKSPILGPTGTRDSLWPALAAPLAAAHGGPVMVIGGAVSGSQIADWLDPRSTYLARLQKQLSLAEAQGYRARFVVWIQGETDAFVQVAPERYANSLMAVRSSLSLAPGPNGPPIWVIVRSTYCMGRLGNGDDLDAEVAATVRAAADPALVLGPLASEIQTSLRRDGCHFNSAGRDLLAAELMETLAPLLARP